MAGSKFEENTQSLFLEMEQQIKYPYYSMEDTSINNDETFTRDMLKYEIKIKQNKVQN